MITVIRDTSAYGRQVWEFRVVTFPMVLFVGYRVEVRATARHKWRAQKVWPGVRTSIRSLRLTRSEVPLPHDVLTEALARAAGMLKIDANLGAGE